MAGPFPAEFKLTASESKSEFARPCYSLDRRDLVQIAVICAVMVGMFWRIVFTSDMLFFRDIFNYSLPLARFIHSMVRQGQLPYWNPYYNWGQHVLSDPNAMFFYPFTLVIVLLPVDFAFSMHFAFHFAWAGVGTYVLARRWGQRRDAALFAALFFALSGPLLSLGNFYNHAASASWIPWVLVAADRVLAERTVRTWIVFALVAAAQFLAAEPVTWMVSFGLAAAYFLFGAIPGSVGAILESPLRDNLRQFAGRALGLLAGWGLAGTAALALAAAQLFPALDLLRHTRRALGVSLDEATFWSLHPMQLLEFVIPDFFGSPFPPLTKWKEVLNGINEPYLVSLYVGFIPLFLALAGWRLARERRARFALGGVAFLLVLAFGRFTPVFGLLFKILPLVHLVRYPVKLAVPATLLVAISAGWGFEALRHPSEDFAARRKALLGLLAVLAAAATVVWVACYVAPDSVRAAGSWLLGRAAEAYAERSFSALSAKDLADGGEYFLASLRLQSPELLGYALGAVLWLRALGLGKMWSRTAAVAVASAGAALLAVSNYGANPVAPRAFYDTSPPALRYFAPSPMPYRFAFLYLPEEVGADTTKQAPREEVPVMAGFEPSAQESFLERVSLRRGTMLDGVESATLDEFDAAFPVPYYEFWRFARSAALRDLGRHDCLLGRANVRYLISFRPRESPASRAVAEVYNPPPVPSFIYEDLCALPRAFVAGSALYSTDPLFTLSRLSDPSFPALEQVILASSAATQVGASLKPAPTSSMPVRKIKMLENAPGRVTLKAELEASGYVVLLDRYDPNWQASVDGHEAPLMRADHMFRAIQVPAGRHEIQVFYHEKWLGAGLAVSLGTAFLLALLYVKKGRARI